MPAILTTAAEIEHWMTAPADEALKLQLPLPDGTLKVAQLIEIGVLQPGRIRTSGLMRRRLVVCTAVQLAASR